MEKKNNRKILEYFTCENKEHWLREIQKSDWGAGQYLYSLLKENKLKALVGATTLVLMLADGDKLVSFCTLAPLDDVQPTSYTPWVGFVYTFPEYRGQHCAGRLLDCAESIAGVKAILKRCPLLCKKAREGRFIPLLLCILYEIFTRSAAFLQRQA